MIAIILILVSVSILLQKTSLEFVEEKLKISRSPKLFISNKIEFSNDQNTFWKIAEQRNDTYLSPVDLSMTGLILAEGAKSLAETLTEDLVLIK